MSQSESEPSINNLASSGNLSGMNLLNNSSILVNPTSEKRPRIGRGGIRSVPPEQLPIIASNYVALDQYEQKKIARNLSAYYSDNVCPIYHSCIKNTRVRMNIAKRKMLTYSLLLLRILILKNRIVI